jgi:hypothetical protein
VPPSMIKISPKLLFPTVSSLLVALLLATNFTGVGISYDTTEYFAGAKQLVESGTYAAIDGRPQATWPPGYSFLLSLPLRLGLSLQASSLIVTALSLIVIAATSLILLRRYGSTPATSVLALVLIFLLPPLIAASSVALSELPFIATVMLALVLATWRNSPLVAVSMGIICGSTYLMRYVGLLFIPIVAAVYLARFARRVPMRQLAIHVVLFALSAIALPLWWTRRNIGATGFATGNREPGGGTYADAARSSIEAIGQLTIGARDWFPTALAFIVGVVVIGLTVTAFLIHLRGRRLELSLISLVPLGYGAFSTYRFVNVEYAPIDLRAMTPLLPLIVISLATAITRFTRRGIAFTVFTAVTLMIAITGLADVGSRANEAEAWGAPRFQDSPLARAVSRLETDAAIISNFPQRAFGLTEATPIRNQYQFDLPPIEECPRRYGLWFTEAPFQGNEPTLADVIYQDDEGRIYDLGDCSTPPKSFWE